MKLLSEADIRKHLNQDLKFSEQVILHILASVDSTNQFLKNDLSQQHIHVCAAETQTQGRGRFGRTWISPPGENIYCSSLWSFETDKACLSGISLVVSLAVMALLKEYDLVKDVKIKWPNDLLWHEKKLCGILIEMLPQ